MKITICDPCKKFDDTNTETLRSLKVKGKSFLNIDVCPKHAVEANKLSMPDFVRYSFKTQGIILTETDQEIKERFLR